MEYSSDKSLVSNPSITEKWSTKGFPYMKAPMPPGNGGSEGLNWKLLGILVKFLLL